MVHELLMYAMRHGVTDMNDAGIIQGKLPARLTEKGRAQAAAHARFIARDGDGPWKILASPVVRTQESAAIVAATLEAPVELCPGLTEIGRGSLEGRTKASLAGEERELYAAFRRDPWNVRVPGAGAESLEDVKVRVERDALPRVRQLLAEPGTLIVVGHGSVVKILTMLLCGYDRAMVLQVPTAHAYLHRISRRSASLELDLLDGDAGYARVDWRALPPVPNAV